MMRAYLIVHDVSFDHVRNITLFIHRQLQAFFGRETGLICTNEIDAAEHDGNAMVFVIGEKFPRHRRRPDCRYVYLNFSIVELMGNRLTVSPKGWSAQRRKRLMLLDKIDLYDAVLDYFPPQTARLRRRLRQPVFSFPSAVGCTEGHRPAAIGDRDFDVCFVGGSSPRRRMVLQGLEDRGLKLSPQSGVVFEEIAARSKVCLNIHSVGSNHLETPRIIGALAMGCPVLTERCFGLETLVPPGMVEVAHPSNIAERAAELLDNMEKLQSLQVGSHGWYRGSHYPRSILCWQQICGDLVSTLA